ncbi:MAG TPA: efflux RND transporter periplasmic adaptor subunit [Allosphingosinicella sp.]|jgi:RND family efflux transporter MFP subunit|nr:efflux RND transporter periplasmic adaptor subunit [Allosphingosinicella sp.]
MKTMNFETPKWGRGALDVQVVDDERARARRRRAIIIALVAAAAVLLVALFFISSRKSAAPAAAGPAAAQGALPTVTVIVPGRQQVARIISATGNLAAKRDIPVGVSGEGGRVIRVLVDRGQWVGAGQVLAVIERSVQSQQAAQQAAQIEVARADARLAQSNLDRAQALVARGFVSKAELEDKRATRDAALARVRVAQAQLGETRARMGLLDVRAPTAGLILDRSVEVGQVVGAGSGALFRMAEGGQMELRAKLAQEDLQRLSVGQPASVTPVGSTNTYRGAIWQISPIIDPQNRQGEARVLIPYNPDLRPGGFASVQITAGATDAPLLPESAVQNDDSGSYVYLVGPDNKIVRRNVHIATVNDKGVVIGDGLNGNERVLLAAAAFVNPGDKVIPRRAAAR